MANKRQEINEIKGKTEILWCKKLMRRKNERKIEKERIPEESFSRLCKYLMSRFIFAKFNIYTLFHLKNKSVFAWKKINLS